MICKPFLLTCPYWSFNTGLLMHLRVLLVQSINQSVNQGCMSPLLEVIPRTTDLHVSAKTDVIIGT